LAIGDERQSLQRDKLNVLADESNGTIAKSEVRTTGV
jgi:hypothetical protein